MAPLDYVDLIAERFSNPKIVDTTRRVAFDGSSRQPGFIVPSIRDGLAAGVPIDGLALVSAAWARMCYGTREDGSDIAPNDPNWDQLTKIAAQAKLDPQAWLNMAHIYGDLAQDTRFCAVFADWLTMIWEQGMDAAIAKYLGDDF